MTSRASGSRSNLDRSTIKLVLWIAAILSIIPAALPGQAGCGRTSGIAEELREHHAPLFYSSDSLEAELRGTAIRRLSPTDTQYVVREDSVCEAVLAVAVAHMRRYNTVWAAGREGNFTGTVIRFGEYYSVSLVTEMPPMTLKDGVFTSAGSGMGARLVFRADTLEILLHLR
jgi:hypothetical protein